MGAIAKDGIVSNMDTQQPQILYFPYQSLTGEDLADCNDVEVMSFHVRLWATKYLNAIYHGLLEPTPAIVQKLKNMNESLKELGKQELPLDF